MRRGPFDGLPDLVEETYKLVAQVPKGRVTTYGAVARALGDVAASRFVGVVMSENSDIERVPCRRVVLSDGHVGGYTGGGTPKKIRLLKEEGIEIVGDRITDLDRFLFDEFEIGRRPLEDLRKRQIELRKRLVLKKFSRPIDRVAGIDVAYNHDHAFAAMVTFEYPSLQELDRTVVRGEARFPYIPTYLGFREIPLIAPLMGLVGKRTVVMYDGNGTLHPEGIGITSQVGVAFGVPTVGVAKKLLCGTVSGKEVEGAHPVLFKNRVIGYSLSKPGQSRQVYVSPGHLVSSLQALNFAKSTLRFRIPEPVRRAHIVAEAARHGQNPK